MRIVLIDPNLVDFSGHPIEFAQSLSGYAKSRELGCILISNKKVKQLVLDKLLGKLLPLISLSCFEDLTRGKAEFFEDLDQINQKIHFTKGDVVVVITSYTNEISATNLYLKNLDKENRPHFYFLVHQLFPPESNFVLASNDERKTYWLERFREECLDLEDEIHICSTPNENLQQKLEEITNKKVKILPLSFDNELNLKTGDLNDIIPKIKSFVFLGDGRYEKGANLFLHAIDRIQNHNLKFLIQRANLRGFPEKELEIFQLLFEKLEKRKSIHVIDKDLSQEVFSSVIRNIDALVLPYHPKSYDLRVSGLLVQALRMGKPAIVSSGTWMEKEVNRFKSGLVFNYAVDNELRTIENLSTAIEVMSKNFSHYAKNAMNASFVYKRTHSAKKFFEEIFSEQ